MIRNHILHSFLFIFWVNLVACSGDDNSSSTPPRSEAPEVSDINFFKDEQAFEDYLNQNQERIDDDIPEPEATAVPTNAISDGAAESITNNQEAGVDEGDIVKAFGDYFVILRKGKLISINTNEDLNTQDIVDSYAPDSVLGTWYDELIINGNTIVVLGYSYAVGATEIGLFSISDDGMFEYRDTYFLRSNDYYSSRNYASRLIGNELVFYMPYYLQYHNYEHYLPAIVNLDDIEDYIAGSDLIRGRDDWIRIIDSTNIYRPVKEIDHPTLHSIIRCDLSSETFSCTAQGIIAPFSRSFYVSQNAVYLWTTEYTPWFEENEGRPTPAVVYQLPLDGGNIRILESYGAPIDQFSFKEDDTHLHMLLRQHTNGDWMWNPEYSRGELTYAKIPLTDFKDTLEVIDDDRYTSLNDPGYWVKNRFIGNYLLYGSGTSTNIHLLNTQDPGELQTIETDSNVSRIDRLGDGAIAVGLQNEDYSGEGGESLTRFTSNLVMNTLSLGDTPTLNDSFVIENAYEGENRSHGYNTTQTEEGSIFGLPIIRYQEIDETNEDSLSNDFLWWGWYPSSAEIVYLRADENLVLESLGSLESEDNQWHSSCEVSCIDWYGNARPIFYQDRIFGLLGYELIEGELDQSALTEIDRVNFKTVSTQ